MKCGDIIDIVLGKLFIIVHVEEKSREQVTMEKHEWNTEHKTDIEKEKYCFARFEAADFSEMCC